MYLPEQEEKSTSSKGVALIRERQIRGNDNIKRSPEDEAYDGNWNHGGHYIRRLDFFAEGTGAKGFTGRIKSYLHLRKITPLPRTA